MFPAVARCDTSDRRERTSTTMLIRSSSTESQARPSRHRGGLNVVAAATIIATTLTLLPAPSQAATPYLQIAPALPVLGQTFTVYGRGFCPRSSCSKIVLTINRHWVAKPFRPAANGRFVRRLRVPKDPGHYVLRATQTGAGGRRLTAALTFDVGAGA